MPSYRAMPAADDIEGKRVRKELEKIGGVVAKIYEKASHEEMRNMYILGASDDLERQSGVKKVHALNIEHER